MAVNGQEPVGSMGTDTPLAVLSDKPPLLFNYFKQLFAQVTNPPLDPIREELVTSLITTIGSEQNLFEETPQHCRATQAEAPDHHQRRAGKDQTSSTGAACARSRSRRCSASPTAKRVCAARSSSCAAAPRRRSTTATRILVLSDRGVDREAWRRFRACSRPAAVHHHLIREGTRTRAAWSSSPASRAKCTTSAC